MFSAGNDLQKLAYMAWKYYESTTDTVLKHCSIEMYMVLPWSSNTLIEG
jgi:hypothetical protein